MPTAILSLWRDDAAQDVAEYALISGVLLVIVVLLIQSVGSNANQVFSAVASKMDKVL